MRRNLTILQNNLGERGYPIFKVRDKIKGAYKVSHDNLLNTQSATKKKRNFIAPLMTTRNPGLPPLSKIIEKHFPAYKCRRLSRTLFLVPLHLSTDNLLA